MRIELLYFTDCPHWELAAGRLGAVLAERQLSVELVLIDSPEQADELGFLGSPSIRIDGHDPFAQGGEPVGLSCRVYPTPDGFAGAPTIEQLRDALHRHTSR